MIKRAWMVFAALWALVLFAIALADGSGSWSPGFFVVALGPLAVPMLLRLFFGYVVFGGRMMPRRR